MASGPFFGFVAMSALGFHTAYPDLALSDILTPAGVTAVEGIGDKCSSEILSEFADKQAGDYFLASPLAVPAWKAAFTLNTPGTIATKVPIFIYQGDEDQIIPVEISKMLLDRYCAIGVTAYRKTYPNTDHTSVIPAALLDITAYVTARIAGQPAPTSC